MLRTHIFYSGYASRSASAVVLQKMFNQHGQHLRLIVMQHVSGVSDNYAAGIRQTGDATVNLIAHKCLAAHPAPHIGIGHLDAEYRGGNAAPAGNHFINPWQ